MRQSLKLKHSLQGQACSAKACLAAFRVAHWHGRRQQGIDPSVAGTCGSLYAAWAYLTTYRWKVLCASVSKSGCSPLPCCLPGCGRRSNTAAAKCPALLMMTTHVCVLRATCCRLCKSCLSVREALLSTSDTSKQRHTAKGLPSAVHIEGNVSIRRRCLALYICKGPPMHDHYGAWHSLR